MAGTKMVVSLVSTGVFVVKVTVVVVVVEGGAVDAGGAEVEVVASVNSVKSMLHI